MRSLLAQRWFRITALFTAINIAGLAAIISLLWQRPARLRVEAFQPEGEVGPHASFTICFSQLMVTDAEVGKPAEAGLVTFTPPIAGRLSWRDRMTLAFQPAERLPLATPFLATVSRKARSLLGHSLAADATYQFHTAPLRVMRVRQTGLGRLLEATIAVEFNDKVVPDEAAEHIVLSGATAKRVAYRLLSRTPSHAVGLVTSQFPERSLTLTVTKGLRGTSGPLGIEQDEAFKVDIQPGLRIEEVAASASAPGSIAIHVSCTQPVDLDEAPSHIQVEPKVSFKVLSDDAGFQLVGPFVSGRRYRVTFLKDLAASDGSLLGRDVARSVIIPDIEPLLHFKTQGLYLAAGGSLMLPLEAVNVREAKVTIAQVYPNNVVHFLRGQRSEDVDPLCRPPREETIRLQHKPNEVQVTSLDLQKLVGKKPRGVFCVDAAEPDSTWRRDSRLILITDLALTVKRSDADMLVWVNALSTARPVAGAAVAVYSKANQELLAGTTDERGIAHFRNVDWSGDRQPFVAAATKDDDTAFVEIEPAKLNDTELDAGGRPYLARGYEAFVYSDRGIYRPGSRVALHAIVRGKDAAVPEPFPVQFRIQRPDGRVFKTLPAKLGPWGSAEVQVDVPAYALTGRYAVELRLPGAQAAIGACAFQVEDFMPDRMKVTLRAAERRHRAGEELSFTVSAHHLFGAPAADRRVEARCIFEAAEFSHPSFPGHWFADSSKQFAPVTEKLGEATLDAKGEHTFTLEIPATLRPPGGLKALIVASVHEVGGRAVTATLERDVDCYPHYVGLARANKEHAQPGVAERVLVAVVKADGQGAGDDLRLEGAAYRVTWNTVLKFDDGRYRFVSEREERSVAKLACALARGRGEVSFTPPVVGEYVVRLADKATGASADIRFYCSGSGEVSWAMDKPARVELVADKKAYAPGDTARILIKAPFAGHALLTVETDRIHHVQVLAMEANTAEVAFPVTAALMPNAYASVTVIRKSAPGSQWMVHRAYGAIPVMLDATPHQLKVEVDSPEETRPGKPLRVALRVRDASGAGRKAEVTLAAVDEGICQLTNFKTPDPWGFFLAKRRLGVATSDIYSLLMPEAGEKKVGADSAPGGDGEIAYDPRLLNPVSVERVKQVALWRSGIETSDDGVAELMLDVPEFTGQLRLMAVAASAREFGACERPTRVKQPLMVQASFPRFLAPGDEFDVPVTIFNNTGKRGAVQLKLDAPAGAQVLSESPGAAEVESGRERSVVFRVRAPRVPGPAAFAVEARLGDEAAAERAEVPVRPAATLQSASGSGAVPAGKTAQFTIPGNWVKGTERCWLSLSPLPALKLGSSLSYLLRYPYGCVEQATSTCFPLLYLGDVAKVVEPELEGKDIEPLVQAGIDRVLSMQTYVGGFGAWPGYAEVYPWGSVYATHFLVEAKKAGYDVPPDNLDAAVAYLDDLVAAPEGGGGRRSFAVSRRGEGVPLEAKAYACLVLAQAGKPNRSWTLRLHELKDELPAYSRFQLAAALALLRETRLASELLAAAAIPPVTTERDTGGLLHSSAREAAILLSVYLDLKPDDPNVPLLVQRLSQLMTEGRWGTTQENAFALMALGKYARRLGAEASDLRSEVTVGGQRLASLAGRESLLLKPADLGGKTVEVTTRGIGTLYYYWGIEGIPVAPTAQERDTSLKVRRRFLSREGKELDPKAIRQGEVIVVELSVDNGVAVKNLVINDLLPAGLEIENPRLATSDAEEETPSAASVSPAERAARPRPLQPDRVEMRDDRLLLFADLPTSGLWRYRYVARAVTCGAFKLPALNAFCMYHPGICSIHGEGTVEVRSGQ